MPNNWTEMFPEFLDVFKVLEFGMTKYGGNGDNWLAPDSAKMDYKSNADSRFHHLAETYTDPHHKDPESELSVLLHEACRALMQYTRMHRNINHSKDIPERIYLNEYEFKNFNKLLSNDYHLRNHMVRMVRESERRAGTPTHPVQVCRCKSKAPQPQLDPHCTYTG